MDKLNVYLSSPYMEFKDTRNKFLNEIKARNQLYDIGAMEYYLAMDKDVLTTCIADVNRCDIYVLILGDNYGSIAKKDGVPSGKSFTYWEYDTALKKKRAGKNIQLLILLKTGPVPANEDPLLTAWKAEIGESQVQTAYYNSQEEIPQIILNSLDSFTNSLILSAIQKKDVLKDKIFLCNRNDINLEFNTSVALDDVPIQFFVLNSHENDLPHYFIKRQEIEYEDRESNWKNINIKPVIPESATEFEKAEVYIKAAIFNELKWKKFKTAKDISPETVDQYMKENNIDYLSISWFIEKALWKNDKLKAFIVSFYQKYSVINTNLKTDKRILFFAILKYVPNDAVSEEEFFEEVKNIQWQHNLPRFSKITKQDIKDWLDNNGIENTEIRSEALISLYLKEINEKDLYYKEIEAGLNKILDRYYN